MKTQITWKGVEADAAIEALLDALRARVEATMPEARFAKFVVEDTTATRAVGLVVSLPDDATWVRHAHGTDWEKTFLEMDRRLDRYGTD